MKANKHKPTTTKSQAAPPGRQAKRGRRASRTVPRWPVAEFVKRKSRFITFRGKWRDFTAAWRSGRMIRTCSPYFAVHHSFAMNPDERKLWSVTHLPSGMCAFSRLGSVRQAQLMAGALAGFPVHWGDINFRGTLDERYKKFFVEVVPELLEWARSWSKSKQQQQL